MVIRFSILMCSANHNVRLIKRMVDHESPSIDPARKNVEAQWGSLTLKIKWNFSEKMGRRRISHVILSPIKLYEPRTILFINLLHIHIYFKYVIFYACDCGSFEINFLFFLYFSSYFNIHYFFSTDYFLKRTLYYQ